MSTPKDQDESLMENDEFIKMSKDSPLKAFNQEDLRKVAKSYNKELDSDKGNGAKYKVDSLKDDVENFIYLNPDLKPGTRSVPTELIYHKYAHFKGFKDLITLTDFRNTIKKYFEMSGNKAKIKFKLDPTPFNFSKEYYNNTVKPDLETAYVKAKENTRKTKFRKKEKVKKDKESKQQKKSEFAKQIISQSAEMDFSEQFKTGQATKSPKRDG